MARNLNAWRRLKLRVAFGLGFVDRREYAYLKSITCARVMCKRKLSYGMVVAQLAPYCTHETDSNSWLYSTVSIRPPREHSVASWCVRLDLPRPQP